MKWEDALDMFATEQRAAGLSDKTIENRRDCLMMLAHASGQPPSTVQRRHLLEMLARRNARTAEPVKPTTKQAERSYLQTFFHWYQSQGFREDNPAATLPKVKVPRRKPRPLRLTQIDAMLDSGAYTRTRDMIMIAALTGLRIGEIVKIRGEDVDIANGVIRSTRKGNLDHVNTIPEPIIQLARRYPREGWWFPSPYPNKLFPDGGGHVLMKSASDRISKALRKAGITDPAITGHSLRHFYATELLRAGAPVRVVQEKMGHASLNTTQLYAEVTEEDMRATDAGLPFIRPRERANRRGIMAA